MRGYANPFGAGGQKVYDETFFYISFLLTDKSDELP